MQKSKGNLSHTQLGIESGGGTSSQSKSEQCLKPMLVDVYGNLHSPTLILGSEYLSQGHESKSDTLKAQGLNPINTFVGRIAARNGAPQNPTGFSSFPSSNQHFWVDQRFGLTRITPNSEKPTVASLRFCFYRGFLKQRGLSAKFTGHGLALSPWSFGRSQVMLSYVCIWMCIYAYVCICICR